MTSLGVLTDWVGGSGSMTYLWTLTATVAGLAAYVSNGDEDNEAEDSTHDSPRHPAVGTGFKKTTMTRIYLCLKDIFFHLQIIPPKINGTRIFKEYETCRLSEK